MKKRRDYSNMPAISCNEEKAIDKLKLQIKRQEPAIFELPEDVSFYSVKSAEFCKYDGDSNIAYDCNPENVLEAIIKENKLAFLKELIEPTRESGSIIDVDFDRGRIIFHD